MQILGLIATALALVAIIALWGRIIWAAVAGIVVQIGGGLARFLTAFARRNWPRLRRFIGWFLLAEFVIVGLGLWFMSFGINEPCNRYGQGLSWIVGGGLLIALSFWVIGLTAQVATAIFREVADTTHGFFHWFWEIGAKVGEKLGFADKPKPREELFLGLRYRVWVTVAFTETIWIVAVLALLAFPDGLVGAGTILLLFVAGLALWALYYARTHQGLEPLLMRVILKAVPALFLVICVRFALPWSTGGVPEPWCKADECEDGQDEAKACTTKKVEVMERRRPTTAPGRVFHKIDRAAFCVVDRWTLDEHERDVGCARAELRSAKAVVAEAELLASMDAALRRAELVEREVAVPPAVSNRAGLDADPR